MLPLKSLHAVSVFFPPILAVRTRGSEEGGGGVAGEMGRGKGHGSLANLYHSCKKLGHTIRLFLVISS